MKKYITTIYIVIFVAGIVSIHALFWALSGVVDNTNYENRMLKSCPKMSETGYLEYTSQWEGYYNDHIPFRNQFIELRNRIGYYLFNSTLGDEVLIGKDGFLFLTDKNQGDTVRDYTGESELSEDELKAIVGNIIANQEYLSDKGIEFVIMISPNKARVYSEYMPDYLGEPANTYAAKQIADAAKKYTDVKIVYSYDDIMSTKDRINQENASKNKILLYHKADTHWNKAGAYVGAGALLKTLDIQMPEITDEDLIVTPIKGNETDLADMLHLSKDFKKTDVDYEITGYNRNNVKCKVDDFGRLSEYVSDADDNRCVYMLRDSFAIAMEEYVGSQFAHTYLRHYDSYDPSDIDKINPDVFVFETVERNAAYKLENFHAW